MQRIKGLLLAAALVMIMAAAAGCSGELGSWMQKAKGTEPQLIKVHIQFTNQKDLVCYVKSMGIAKDAQVYTGGPSANNMYDRNGNITGSFNYQQVMYMEIVPEEVTNQN